MGKLIILTDTSLNFNGAKTKLKELGLLDDNDIIKQNCAMFSGRMLETGLVNILEMLNNGETVVLHNVSGPFIEMVK